MRTKLFAAGLMTLSFLVAAGPAGAQEKPPEPPSGSGSSGSSSGQVKPDFSGPLQITEVVWTVGGKRVDSIPAGSQANAEVTITNSGKETAKGVTISIAPSEGAGRVVDGSASFGDIAPNGAGKGSLSVVANESECAGFVAFSAKVTSSLGEQPNNIGAGVLCPGPQLYVGAVKFTTSDGDEISEPGETVNMIVTLTNGGRDAATGVTASLTFDDPNITIVTGKASWPDIPSGGEAVNAEPFVITISKDAKTQDNGCGGMAKDTGGVANSGGDAGSPDDTVSSEPAQTAIAPAPADQPSEKPSDSPTDAPAPAPAPDERYAMQEPSVTVAGKLAVAASGKTFTLDVGNMIVCMYSETAKGGAAGGAPVPDAKPVADDKATRTVATGAHDAGASGGGSATVAFLIMVGVAGVLLRYRLRPRSAAVR